MRGFAERIYAAVINPPADETLPSALRAGGPVLAALLAQARGLVHIGQQVLGRRR